MIYERYHTRDMTKIGGLWNRLPSLAFFLILAALGSAAVPGLNGFVGEFPILIGTFATSRRAGVLAATGMVLGACYLLWMLREVLFGPLTEPAAHAPVPAHAPGSVHPAEGSSIPSQGSAVPAEGSAVPAAIVPPVGWHEIAGLAPVMFLIVAIGIYPRPILEQMRPALARIDEVAQLQRDEAKKQLPIRSFQPGVEHPGPRTSPPKKKMGGTVDSGSSSSSKKAATKPTSKAPSGSPGPAAMTPEKRQ
jgi:NADH-quinone oxidoreductase subunit M